MGLKSGFKLTMLASLVAGSAAQVSAQTLKARELFYSPPPTAHVQPKGTDKKTTAPKIPVTTPRVEPPKTTEPISRVDRPTVPVMNASLAPLALRYSVLKRDAQGSFTETDSDSTFKSGDRIRNHRETGIGEARGIAVGVEDDRRALRLETGEHALENGLAGDANTRLVAAAHAPRQSARKHQAERLVCSHCSARSTIAGPSVLSPPGTRCAPSLQLREEERAQNRTIAQDA